MPQRVRHAPTRPGDEQPTVTAASSGAEIWRTIDVPPEAELTLDDDSDDNDCYFGNYVDEADVDDGMADVDDADAGSDGGRDAGWDSESDVEAMDYDSA